jgi:bifunctional isochorismate lyase/aryl carrier protein
MIKSHAYVKEQYFTSQSIGEKSQEMRLSLAGDQPDRLDLFEPHSSALLVLDMQAYFLDPNSHAYVPSASAIVPCLQALVETFVAYDRPVIFTRHLNTPQNAGQMATWWRNLISEENPLSAIIPAFEPSVGSVVIKNQYDAFFGTSLEELLHSQKITQLVFGGVMTHLCCETTARSAFMRGFAAFFTIDGTATYTEAHHRAALLNLAHGFATPVLSTEILAIMQREARGNA